MVAAVYAPAVSLTAAAASRVCRHCGVPITLPVAADRDWDDQDYGGNHHTPIATRNGTEYAHAECAERHG